MTPQRAAESIQMIKDSDGWPGWPILPVVNRDLPIHDDKRVGLIHAADPTTIRLGNMFDMNQEKWDAAEQLKFDDVEALVDAGWEVD